MKQVNYTCDGCGTSEMSASRDDDSIPYGWLIVKVELSGSASITANWFPGERTIHACSRKCAALCVTHA